MGRSSSTVRAKGFSQGQRLKTALARALIHEPNNVVLDEPTNGLDVMATRALRDIIQRPERRRQVRALFEPHHAGGRQLV